MAKTETFEFQAEVKQVLDLMIHSVYTTKDVFLRELISNASDAIDKLRFEVMNKTVEADIHTPEIRLEPDADARTLTIRDNGIGMNHDELIKHIGTVAKSGTKEFLKLIKESKDNKLSPELIGQFGVGFYSVFMVADEVSIITRRAGETDAWLFRTTNDGTYQIEPSARDSNGTTITLKLKAADEEDGIEDFTSDQILRGIVRKYSDFVAHPIKMNVSRTEYERDDKGKIKEGTEPKTIVELQTLNSMKALWTRSKDDVTADEYKEFYKHISHDWNDPFETIHFKAEGAFEFHALLFIPTKPPFDLFMHDRRKGVNLYVKRVFIMDDCDDLLPDWLRFVRGVVDSEDLSLNISREMLQNDRRVSLIRKRLVGKILDSLKAVSGSDSKRFNEFWESFGKVVKEGLYQDEKERKSILDIARFHTTSSDGETRTLAEYITSMAPGQDKIYFITADSLDAAKHSPHLESARSNGYEVLLLIEPVDEIWTQHALEFEGKSFQSLLKGDADSGGEDERKAAKEARDKQAAEMKGFIDWLKDALKDDVRDVRISSRLKESAACLVGEDYDMTPGMARLFSQMGQAMPSLNRILEINPSHPLIETLRAKQSAGSDGEALKNYAKTVYALAVIGEGGKLKDPGVTAQRLSAALAAELKGEATS